MCQFVLALKPVSKLQWRSYYVFFFEFDRDSLATVSYIYSSWQSCDIRNNNGREMEPQSFKLSATVACPNRWLDGDANS